MTTKPVVFMNGDDSTRRGATMVREIVFGDFPFIECDTGVEARLATNDECIRTGAKLLAEHKAGIKISTASDDKRIKERGLKSANILLRPLAGVVGMYRQTMAPGGYKRPVAVMRFGSGDFYCETSCKPAERDGLSIRIITQEIVFSDFAPFALAACERAKRNGLQIIIASKWTISEGEKLIADECERIFLEQGLKKGETRGSGDFYRELSDMACAYIPTNVGLADKSSPMSGDNGGWMIVTGNANGDTFADVADLQHRGNSMGSECICRGGFSYYPIGTLVAFCGAISGVNPGAQKYCDAVMTKAAEYMTNTPEADRCTQTMLEWVAKEARKS